MPGSCSARLPLALIPHFRSFASTEAASTVSIRLDFHTTPWDDFVGGKAKPHPALAMQSLTAREKGTWFPRPWDNIECLPAIPSRCVVTVTQSGLDLIQRREANFATGALVENGFSLPELRSQFRWVAPDQALVAADTDPSMMTVSGFSRVVRLWRRGEPLSAARIIFEGQATDAIITPWTGLDRGSVIPFVIRRIAAPNLSTISLVTNWAQPFPLRLPSVSMSWAFSTAASSS